MDYQNDSAFLLVCNLFIRLTFWQSPHGDYDHMGDIIICKQDNEYVIKYCSDDRIIAREYELVWYNIYRRWKNDNN